MDVFGGPLLILSQVQKKDYNNFLYIKLCLANGMNGVCYGDMQACPNFLGVMLSMSLPSETLNLYQTPEDEYGRL